MNIRHDKSCPCPVCRQKQEDRRFKWIIAALLLVGLLVLTPILTSCASTITPPTVTPQQASFDGNDQNSGIIRYTPAGFLVTPHFRDRYNALVDTYGRTFKPELEHDAGMKPATDGTNWTVDAQHMADFVTMNLKKKSGISP